MKQVNMEQSIKVVVERDIPLVQLYHEMDRYKSIPVFLRDGMSAVAFSIRQVLGATYDGISEMQKFEPYKFQLEL